MNYTYILLGLLVLGVSSAAHGDGAALALRKSPRLWVGADTARDLSSKLHSPYMQEHARLILEDADWLVDAKPIAEGEAGTYQHGTRTISAHLQCLTAAWVLTGKAEYRAAAIRHLGNLLSWNQISCEANSGIPPERVMPFCLSYGEHAADIGLMYDLFRPDITPEEQQVFFAVLDRFHLKAALNCLDRPPWWAYKRWSNWNGVCAGGIGIMALAFYEDRPECQALLPFVEKSLGEYFKSYIENGGGCHEGTGYWNYGMHYAIRYLLSWENATGRKHPVFAMSEMQKTLNFPLDFHGITFGDNDGWHPTGMFFLMARRVNNPDAALRAATYLPARMNRARPRKRSRLSRVATGDNLFAGDAIPSPGTMKRFRGQHEDEKEPLARVYDGLGWGVLADDSAFPSLRLSVRGGSSRIAGHGHIDLLSFKCMINGERMITDQSDRNRVAFTHRGHHLYGRSAASKSTMFVDGLGCGENTTCTVTETVRGEGLLGIRIDGSGIYMPHWRGRFIGRLFLLVESRYWLVISSAAGHSLESRFHTFADFTHGRDWASLKQGEEEMMVTFAGLGRSVMQRSKGMPSSPRKQTNIFRWMSNDTAAGNVQVAVLNPGSDKLGVAVSAAKENGYAIEVSGPNGYKRTIRVTARLALMGGS